jgi:hypothetical protein
MAVNLGSLTVSAIYENLSITEADLDWYYFDLPASSGAQVTLSFAHDIGDLQLELFDAQKVLLEKSDSSTSSNGMEVINLDAVTGTTRYFLKVSGVDVEVVQPNYSLKLEPSGVTRSETIAPDNYDTNGDNNLSQKATNIGSLGDNESRNITGLSLTPEDQDWFVYNPSRLTDLNPNAVSISGYSGDLILQVYDQNRQLLGESNTLNSSSQTVGFGSTNGLVYIHVSSEDELLSTEYQLSLARRNFDIDGNGTVGVSDIQLAYVNLAFGGAEAIDSLNAQYGFVQNGSTRPVGEDIVRYLDNNAQGTMLDANFDGQSTVQDIQLAYIFYAFGQGNPAIAAEAIDTLGVQYGLFDPTKTNGTEIAQYINFYHTGA